MDRFDRYADAIIRMIGLKAGERVWVSAPVGAKELVLLLQKKILAAGSFADLDISFEEAEFCALSCSSPENLRVFSPISRARIESCDKTINIWCLGDYVIDYGAVPSENLKTSREVYAENSSKLDTTPGVGVYFPTEELAKKAGMEWEEYLEFFFGAVNVDLKALYDEYRWLEKIINEGKSIRVVGSGTDLTVDITGRPCLADVSYFWNLPDGELFTSPVETGTRGYITFEHELVYRDSVAVRDLRLEFHEGYLSSFSASEGEKFFGELIETDEGARRLGEIGIGINPRVDRFTNNELFDEKIIGTVHFALGNGFIEANSRNESAIHWDLVKDLRDSGRIFVDNRLVFDSGRWIRDDRG